MEESVEEVIHLPSSKDSSFRAFIAACVVWALVEWVGHSTVSHTMQHRPCVIATSSTRHVMITRCDIQRRGRRTRTMHWLARSMPEPSDTRSYSAPPSDAARCTAC
eukprot:90139-Rhodomonas_salina.5